MAQSRSRTQAQARPANDAPKQRSSAAAALMDDSDERIVAIDSDALGTITKSEVIMQLEAAHRWPRNIKRFVEETTALATMDKPTAQSCIFTLPARKGSTESITGPSVRLAEMVASSWGNLHTGARIIDTGARDVTAQALVWDLEKNVRMGFEVKRGIVTKDGHRYGDDMIRVTAMAAISIALRNAIFRVVPGALVNGIYNSAKLTATGVADNTFDKDRVEVVGWFVNRWRVPLERILARLGISKVDDITPDLLETLIGLGQAVKTKESTIDEAFPPIGGAAPAPPRGKGAALDVLVNASKTAAPAVPATPAAVVTPEQAQAELAKADPAWQGEDRVAFITNEWTPEQVRIAHAWALTFNSDVDDADLPERPAFTVIRIPGED